MSEEFCLLVVLLAAEPVVLAVAVRLVAGLAAVPAVELVAFAAVAFVVAVVAADLAALVDTLAAVDFERTQKHDLDLKESYLRSAECLCLDFVQTDQ